MKKVWEIIKRIGEFIFKFRKIFMSLPVLGASVYLAVQNGRHLPERVGLILTKTGDFSLQVSKSVAIWGPLGITALCLLLMSISKKTLYPWLIACFTLIIPPLIWFLNQFQV